MVCPRCIQSVADIFATQQIPVQSVNLGEVITISPLNEEQIHVLEEQLASKGFELLKDKKVKLVTSIKSLIIKLVHYNTEGQELNFSTFLSNELKQDYTTLSKLFSSVEGQTIERFILKQKIEKVKELLFYGENSLAEIAHQLHYSSAAYLSNLFKRETGMTPSEFRKQKTPRHKPLDSI